jgi:hypothetical protein
MYIEPWARSRERRRSDELKGDIGANEQVLISSFRKPPIISPEKRNRSARICMKMPLLSQGLRLSNSKPGCGV